MTEALRPMSTGELLDRTFSLYKKDFLLFLGVAMPAPAVLLVLVVLISFLDSSGTSNTLETYSAPTVMLLSGGLMVGCAILVLLAFALSSAATIRAVAAVHLSHSTSIRASYRELRGRYFRIVGVFISVFIRAFGGSILLYFASFMVVGMAAGLTMWLGRTGIAIAAILGVAAFVSGMLLALTLFVRYSMAIQACVIEEISAKQAIKRSKFLSRGSRNRILTIYVLFSVISGAVWGCLSLLAALIGSGLLHSEQVTSALMALAFFLTLLLTVPLATVALSLAYYDERVRKEGFDLEIMVAALQATQATSVTAS